MLKIKLNELEWMKFEMVIDEKYNIIDHEASHKQLEPLSIIKLNNGTTIVVGQLNSYFGECDCCSSINIDDIKEYAKIQIEE